VCVVPKSLEYEVFTGAFEKVHGENHVRIDLENGMSARAAFIKHGIM
jgi:hypothetical protein